MKTEDWDKVGEELIDQIEAGRHIYMKLRHTTSKETADHGVAWFRGLVEGVEAAGAGRAAGAGEGAG